MKYLGLEAIGPANEVQRLLNFQVDFDGQDDGAITNRTSATSPSLSCPLSPCVNRLLRLKPYTENNELLFR